VLRAKNLFLIALFFPALSISAPSLDFGAISKKAVEEERTRIKKLEDKSELEKEDDLYYDNYMRPAFRYIERNTGMTFNTPGYYAIAVSLAKGFYRDIVFSSIVENYGNPQHKEEMERYSPGEIIYGLNFLLEELKKSSHRAYRVQEEVNRERSILLEIQNKGAPAGMTGEKLLKTMKDRHYHRLDVHQIELIRIRSAYHNNQGIIFSACDLWAELHLEVRDFCRRNADIEQNDLQKIFD
jgi:hypothetical protein